MSEDDPRLATVRQNLRLAIAYRDTTAAEISRAAGLSVNGLGSFLRAKSSISYANLLRVCDALRIPIGILHRPGAITPGRLELQEALEGLSPDQVERALALVEEERPPRP
ncbi:helix-turn-helix domain-containing protein [Defluviimonas sp. D31]|uniref:helix-turn-helix domain-containing protein n=1 Tax=Defluviimonas sp. D31 TaxID=3083253 RepID=UPI00296F1873|nr:helix-turn-helix domain-containing protein [Defluviimonas sp. D31]MDW4550861.1 helix-turn-helix domain-containing protein [Defluviimonas sp. D31]